MGGGRGRGGVWSEPSVGGINARYHEYRGEPVLFNSDTGALSDVLRLFVDGGEITRLVDYCYAPDVLSELASTLGVDVAELAYHQGEGLLPRMIATTTLSSA